METVVRDKQTFNGFSLDKFTLVPDHFLDEVLPQLTGSELKTMLCIIGYTFGKSVPISLEQIITVTGLSKSSVSQSIIVLERDSLIIREVSETGVNGYSVKFH